jgi:hypothetical protein
MTLFRRMKATLYRWRIARIDRRLDALQLRRRGQTDRGDVRELGRTFDALAIDRAVMIRRLGRLTGELSRAQGEIESGRVSRAP